MASWLSLPLRPSQGTVLSHFSVVLWTPNHGILSRYSCTYLELSLEVADPLVLSNSEVSRSIHRLPAVNESLWKVCSLVWSFCELALSFHSRLIGVCKLKSRWSRSWSSCEVFCQRSETVLRAKHALMKAGRKTNLLWQKASALEGCAGFVGTKQWAERTIRLTDQMTS